MKKFKTGINPSSLFLFLLISLFTISCVTTKRLSESDLPYRQSHYILHCNNSKYYLNKVIVDSTNLTGIISSDKVSKGITVHLYVTDQTQYTITGAGEISIPLTNISQVKAREFNFLMTVGLGAVIILVAPVLVLILQGGYDM